jgi:hypothetical protein
MIDGLRFLGVGEVWHGLEFNKDRRKANEVCTVSHCQWLTTIHDRQSLFPLEWHAGLGEFAPQSLAVNRLQKTMTQFAVNSHCSPNDGVYFPVSGTICVHRRHLRIITPNIRDASGYLRKQPLVKSGSTIPDGDGYFPPRAALARRMRSAFSLMKPSASRWL